MHVSLRALVALPVLVSLSAAQAQTRDLWRDEVDTLVSRWSNDVGSSRVTRALKAVDGRLERAPNDAEALLEQARLLLAETPAPGPDMTGLTTSPASPEAGRERQKEQARDAWRQADRAKASADRALAAADRAAELLPSEARPRALAIGFVAARDRLHAELRRMRTLQGNPQAERLIKLRNDDLMQRRARLIEACGQEEADLLIRTEVERERTLRHVDRLGSYPRPIGTQDVAGEAIDLTRYDGKVLLVLFWSSRVGEPEALLRRIEEVRAALGPRGFEVLAINCDETRERFEQTVAALGLQWRHCFEGRGLASQVASAWSVGHLPAGALIDHTGRVRYLDPWAWDLRLAVEDLLARRDRTP